ncbi:Fe-S cluster assembly protein NifU [Shewanella sp. C32]|uniref:Nitrogen fixation protein NifU n=1 Tax=Shewanella electrica TaxID=515560 RepID=A0ABT2FHY3_9GAMM|nr:Fe-S cluster assembly protein NifU [Shewanella electrica]MCH1924036.1 Fe-S cluster assembly protein NifU [Shewanella electrica]MCS4555939.1 Fe-S cluster assembly protein NifU [Shewanella electrica]
MWDYSEKVKQHFFNPKNAKLVSDANARGDVGSISCGDALSLSLKVNPDTEIIEDAGFQTFGCGSAIASSSALTEIIIGKTLDDALKVTNQEIADFLDGLPPEKMHCSVMGMEALHAAVANYRGEVMEDDHEEGELICKCFAIDDLMIKRVVKANGLQSIEEVVNYTKAGGACTSCHEKIEWVLDEALAETAEAGIDVAAVARANQKVAAVPQPIAATAKPKMAVVSETSDPEHAKRLALIEQVIDEVRPAVQADGGDIQLVDVEDHLVFVSMSGNCSGCGLSGLTLANLEIKISDALGETVTVFPLQPSSEDAEKKEATYDL